MASSFAYGKLRCYFNEHGTNGTYYSRYSKTQACLLPSPSAEQWPELGNAAAPDRNSLAGVSPDAGYASHCIFHPDVIRQTA